jgi:hypothetical protein
MNLPGKQWGNLILPGSSSLRCKHTVLMTLHRKNIPPSTVLGMQIAADIASLRDTGSLCPFLARSNSQPCMGPAKSNIVDNTFQWRKATAQLSLMHSKTLQGTAFRQKNLPGSTSPKNMWMRLMPQQGSRFQRSIVLELTYLAQGTETLRGMAMDLWLSALGSIFLLGIVFLRKPARHHSDTRVHKAPGLLQPMHSNVLVGKIRRTDLQDMQIHLPTRTCTLDTVSLDIPSMTSQLRMVRTRNQTSICVHDHSGKVLL